jgi:hypothetical protein
MPVVLVAGGIILKILVKINLSAEKSLPIRILSHFSPFGDV